VSPIFAPACQFSELISQVSNVSMLNWGLEAGSAFHLARPSSLAARAKMNSRGFTYLQEFRTMHGIKHCQRASFVSSHALQKCKPKIISEGNEHHEKKKFRNVKIRTIRIEDSMIAELKI